MLTATSFHTVQVQSVVYTPGLQFQSTKALVYFLTSEWQGLFDGEPITQPLPPGAPPELARLILMSRDGRLRLQAGPARADLYWARQDSSTDFDISDHLRLAAKLLIGYLRHMEAHAGRLACVVTRVAPDRTPGVTLARHFCQPRWLSGPLNRPGDFELGAHKRFALGGRIEVNSWFRCKTGALEERRSETDSPITSPVIIVEQDLNTLSEEVENREYTSDEIAAFFGYIPGSAEEIMELYFPGGTEHE
jgi:hypothetical protein